MKTITRLAGEKYSSQRNLPAKKQIPAENFIDWANWGAREAQRWFKIDEDELPDPGEANISENVILQLTVHNTKRKNSYSCCIEAYYDSDTNLWIPMLPIDDKNLELIPIAWRPIIRI